MIGSNTFIPGFEEQLIGAVAGEPRKIEATFPEAYATRTLAGRKARVRRDASRRSPRPSRSRSTTNSPRAYGEDSVDALQRQGARDDRQANTRALRARGSSASCSTRSAARYAFEVPEGLVEQEFSAIWTPGRARAEGFGPQLRRREHHRRGGAQRIPRASPSGACASACCWPRSAPRPTSRSPTRR